jgi:uncharacterized paraquat-inducible protein A
MKRMTGWNWVLVSILAAMHVAISVRVALAAGVLGRSRARWFFITLCLTGLPAMIVFQRDARRRLRQSPPPDPTAPPPGGLVRCPRCRALVDRSEIAPLPVRICPRCRQPMDEVNLA